MTALSESIKRKARAAVTAGGHTSSRRPEWKKRWLQNSSRVWLTRYNRGFAKNTRPDMLVLDAGAGTAPYRPLFRHARYETADFNQLPKKYPQQTYVCDLTDIPVEDGRFDRVVFNQVLEHMPDPSATLRELWRVTKPGGQIICTTPLYYEEHQKPYDFFRYTQFGLTKLFTDAGFVVERLDWMEGYLGTVGYQLEGMHRHLPPKPPADWSIWKAGAATVLLRSTKVLGLLLAGLFYKLDKEWKFTDAGYPKNFVIIASKPAPSNPTEAS